MTVGIVLVTRFWRASIDHDGYIAALRKLGCEPLMICRGNDAGEADCEIVEATERQQANPCFWKGLQLDGAIVWNWLRGPEMIKALRDSGVRTVLRADSDGMVSNRVFPWQRLKLALASVPCWSNKPGILKDFLLDKLPGSLARDLDLIQTIRLADAVAIESDTAKNHLIRILRTYQTGDLEPKISVVPHSVRDNFVDATLPPAGERGRRIFCGGRWDDRQKDAPLLARTIEPILKSDTSCRITICGRGAHEAFGKIANRHDRVTVRGLLTPRQVTAELGASRVLLSSSRWETQPIGSLEALCMGCSIAAPAIPGFTDLPENGRYGTLARDRSAAALANAVLDELSFWDAGRRNSQTISAAWRPRVSNHAVVANLLALINS